MSIKKQLRKMIDKRVYEILSQYELKLKDRTLFETAPITTEQIQVIRFNKLTFPPEDKIV